MEKAIEIIVSTLFGIGVACFFAMVAFWTAAAFFCLTPEAKDRFWWNPYNGTLNPQNLTERGQWLRRLAIRCLMLFIAFPICGMIVGVVLMLAFNIPVDRPEDKNIGHPSSGVAPPKQEAEQDVHGNTH
jgi:hypothetical protein